MIFCIAMGNQRLRTGRIVLFSSVANDPTESTRDFGRISRVFPILYRVYNSIIYGIRFGAVSLEMDMTRPSRTDIGRVFEPWCEFGFEVDYSKFHNFRTDFWY